MEHREQ